MRDHIHYFETDEDCDCEQSLLVSMDVGKLPSYKDSQRDEQDQTAKDVANDRLGMGPLARRGDASDSTLRTHRHADNNQQNNIQTDIGEQRDLLPRRANKYDPS